MLNGCPDTTEEHGVGFVLVQSPGDVTAGHSVAPADLRESVEEVFAG